MTDSPRILVVASDLHVGSKVALCPDGFVDSDGCPVALNSVQRWIGEQWASVWQETHRIIGEDRWVLALNGDMIEGRHHGAGQVWSVEPGDHVRAVVELLQPVAETADAVLLTLGTECHAGVAEIGIGMALDAMVDPETGLCAANRWDVEVAGSPVVVRHHMGASSRPWLTGTQLSIQRSLERERAGRHGLRPPRAICLAHRHVPEHSIEGGCAVVVTAPWQARTRYGHRVAPASDPVVGLTILDWRRRPDDSAPEVVEVLRVAKPSAPIRL
jgi:hypothetical protein